jgi:hypothetical protein
MLKGREITPVEPSSSAGNVFESNPVKTAPAHADWLAGSERAAPARRHATNFVAVIGLVIFIPPKIVFAHRIANRFDSRSDADTELCVNPGSCAVLDLGRLLITRKCIGVNKTNDLGLVLRLGLCRDEGPDRCPHAGRDFNDVHDLTCWKVEGRAIHYDISQYSGERASPRGRASLLQKSWRRSC